MSWLNKILGAGLNELIKKINELIDKFNLSIEEKQQLRSELEQLLQKKDEYTEETIRAELASKEHILITELTQGDSYTKRARPSVIYAGLVFILLNYCLIPAIQSIVGAPVKPFELPMEFWIGWSGIVATYSIGRSVEKRGTRNLFTKITTGAAKSSLLTD